MRSLRIVASSLVAYAIAACAGEPTISGADDELKASSLAIEGRASLPIAEVSGLGRRRVGAKSEYLAVSDSSAVLVTFDVGPRGGVSNVAQHDLGPLVGASAPQWEAVAGDGAGNVFVLAEASDRIVVIDPTLGKVRHTFEIAIPPDHPLSSAWKRDTNSHGEGMVLLANGHVLVVKEKEPVAILELAAPGATAEGYDAALALGDGTFRVPAGAKSALVPVHHWLLKDAQSKLASDVSELALDPEGRLLLLSDQDRAIVRIESGLRPDEDKIDIKAAFVLPGAIDKPEGLTLAEGRPLVAVDTKESGETLFRIEGLE